MSGSWLKVFSTNQPYHIEILKALLSENNIESNSIDKRDSAYFTGEIELYVKSEDAILARVIIEKENL